MKKTNVNDVGTYWTILILILMPTFAMILNFELGLIISIMYILIFIFLGIPYLIVWLWNTFLAKD